MFLKRALVGLVVVGFAGAAALAQGADPMVGTWKLNTAKSKSPYKSGATVIAADGDGFKVTADLVGTDDKAYHWTWAGKYDGKDNAVTGTTPYGAAGLTASMTRVDKTTVKIVGKRDGKEVLTQTVVVSADGKSRTVTTKPADPKAPETVSFYDRQ